MNNQKRSYRRYVVITVITLLIVGTIWLGLAMRHSKSFHVVSTNPPVGSISTVTPFLDVTFNRQLSSNGLRVSSTPNIVSSFSVKGDSLDMVLREPFSSDKSYTIVISGITDTGGEHLSNQRFSFTPKNTPEKQLPKDQVQALIKNQKQGTIEHSDPILGYLPHETIDYDLTYSYSGTQLVLQAQLFLSEADMSNETAAEAQYEQEVVTYIQSLGLEPGNYTIQYNVQTP